ncbi:MAG TPA: 8-oxo-dGTP diphosphatase MutT [Verrucomicrobiae bacterium]|jgi:mutator protein MutT|nr:8-oxo-dGTP diphosphatase MutT [Verrucomicrobiae bacterium]
MNSGGPPIEVAAGLVFREGKLLITERPAKSHLGGLWEFPGGKREAGESFEQCLRRELTEELGIEVQVHELVEDLIHHYPERSVHLKFFRCRWLRHEPRAILCHDWKWIGLEQMSDFQFPAADARLLEKLRSDWRQMSAFAVP